MIRLIVFILSAILINSCGSTRSLTENNLVPFAVITLPDSTTISGEVIREDEDRIIILRGKNLRAFKKSEIEKYILVDVPSEHMMKRDMVKNMNKIATAQTVSMIMSMAFAFSTIVIWIYND